MFEIKYRITANEVIWRNMDLCQLNYEGVPDGFFALNFNNSWYGYYHNNNLREGEEGTELINTWFDHLLETYIAFENNSYVALSDVESYNTWLEFIVQSNDDIRVSIIINEDKPKEGFYSIKPFKQYKYGDWNDVIVSKIDFKKELVAKTENYLNELIYINPLFHNTFRVRNVISLLEKVKKMN